MADAPPRAIGVASADSPTRISAMPKIASGRGRRATRRPAAPLPSARPAMNAASTVLAAYTVTPKTSESRRSHRTW